MVVIFFVPVIPSFQMPQTLASRIRWLVNVVFQLLVSLVKIIIDNNLVMNTGRLGELELIMRLCQSLLHIGLVLGPTATEP